METGTLIVKDGWSRSLRRLGTLLLDQLYPPVCLACDAPVATADALCTSCFRGLRPITAPLCPILGLPFEVSLGPDAVSAEAIAHPPNFERARSAVVYNAVARGLVGKLKYGDRPELARFCARLVALAGHELWGSDAVLVPVPLHRARQFSRRYNQSTELARALGKLTGLPVESGLVMRKRNTRHQVGLSGDAGGATSPGHSRRIPTCCSASAVAASLSSTMSSPPVQPSAPLPRRSNPVARSVWMW